MQYEVTSGPGGSGVVQSCCNGTDLLVSFKDCSVGASHTAKQDNPQCASTTEGAMNGGDACIDILCVTSCGD